MYIPFHIGMVVVSVCQLHILIFLMNEREIKVDVGGIEFLL